MPKRLYAKTALLKTGWASDVCMDIDGNGMILAIEKDASDAGAEQMSGPVIAGMTNLHSHAFQRVMAGMAERRGATTDSFWTWRDIMYKLVAKLNPDEMEAVALRLYVECLKRGYTGVCEFHYVHHQANGRAYDNRAETSLAIMNAAKRAGIALSHLPVLYSYSGFGSQPLGEAQKRFGNDVAGILDIIDICKKNAAAHPNISVGIALHSLRAVDKANMLTALADMDTASPKHIHIAEQMKEVKDCMKWSGMRPVEWLFDNVEVDNSWCLIHATHLSDDECDAIAKSGAVAGLCPTTEGNLGDGLFPLDRYLKAGGRIGIGSDSHVSQCPVEELRLLEYGQRLHHQRRNIATTETTPSVGQFLWESAAIGGAQAANRDCGIIEVGKQADLVVLDGDNVNLAGRTKDMILDSLIFAGNDNLVKDVMVGGNWVVKDGQHTLDQESAAAFKKVVATVKDD